MSKGSTTVIVYSLENCPNCDLLKEHLKEKGIGYREEDMGAAGPLTELRLNGVFVREAPVLRIGDLFLTSSDLFLGGNVREEAIRSRLAGDHL
jgi:glutaredoxin